MSQTLAESGKSPGVSLCWHLTLYHKPLREISDPSALVQTLAITGQERSRFLPLSGASLRCSPWTAVPLLLTHLRAPHQCHQLYSGSSASIFHAAREHHNAARQWEALRVPLPQPVGCLQALSVWVACAEETQGLKMYRTRNYNNMRARPCHHEDGK